MALPPTGINRLLEYSIPIRARRLPPQFVYAPVPGVRRCAFNAPQLLPLHLLALLTSTPSLNWVVAQLPEQAAWRQFCRMHRPWRHRVDGARVSDAGRRQQTAPNPSPLAGAIAAPPRRATPSGRAHGCHGLAGGLQRFQKKHQHPDHRPRGVGRAHAQDRSEPLVCWLQETHTASVAAHSASLRDVGAAASTRSGLNAMMLSGGKVNSAE